MGSGGSQNDIGWNIDDIEVLGTGPGSPAPDFSLTVTANNPSWGTVNPSGGTYSQGSAVQITAAPATYYQFLNWTGDATGTNNPLTVLINTNMLLHAGFAEILTRNYPTPVWWLASYGYTQNLESAVTTLGSNGVPLWQSYIAGLHPNDPNSQLRLSVRGGSKDGNVLHWNTVTGRVYTVWSSTDAMSSFSPLPNAANLSSTITDITNSVNTTSPMTFYRLEVLKP
jgi:hypothetical protein